jgi:4-hydroxybenzoate polyprenyltransferase
VRSVPLSRYTVPLDGYWKTLINCSDICDRDLDAKVERCKTRPLPSGRISTKSATVVFIIWFLLTILVTRITLGEVAVRSSIPVYAFSAIYPYMKRLIPFPQVVVGAAYGSSVYVGHVAVTQNDPARGAVIPLSFAAVFWIIFFDTCYATQDSAEDRKHGIKSLTVILGSHVRTFLVGIHLIQVTLLAITAVQAGLSPVFWVLGLGVWSYRSLYHVTLLRWDDPRCGGVLFDANVKLMVYVTAIFVIDPLFVKLVIAF